MFKLDPNAQQIEPSPKMLINKKSCYKIERQMFVNVFDYRSIVYR